MRGRSVVSAAVLVASLVVGAVVSVVSGKLILWDLKNYHLYNAYVLATGRMGHDLNPAFFQSYINPVPYLPFYALTRGPVPDDVAAALLGALHALNAWLLLGISRRCLGALLPEVRDLVRDALAFVAAAIGIAGPMFLPLLGSSSADPLSGLVVLSGLGLLLGAESGRQGTGRCAGASLVFGFAVGAKLTNVVFVVAFAIVLLVWRARQPAFGRTLVAVAVAGAAGISLGGGAWSWTLWQHFESPLFPFYNEVFESPYTGPENFRDRRFLPEHYGVALFTYPWKLALGTSRTLETPFRDPRWAILSILVVAWALQSVVRRRRPRDWEPTEPTTATTWAPLLALLGFVGLSYAVWLGMFAIQRYLLPGELLVGPCIVGLVVVLLRAPAARAVALAAIVACVVAVTTTPPNIWHRIPWTGRWLEVEVPPIPEPARTTVLLLTADPAGYVVPFFPEEVRFVRVLARKFEGHRLWEALEAEVADPDRRLLALVDPRKELRSRWRTFLETRGIEVVPESCRHLETPSHEEHFSLCETRRRGADGGSQSTT